MLSAGGIERCRAGPVEPATGARWRPYSRGAVDRLALLQLLLLLSCLSQCLCLYLSLFPFLISGAKPPPYLRSLAVQGPAQVGFEFGIFRPVIATGGLGNGDGVCFLLRVLAPGGSEFLQSIPVDDSLLLDDIKTLMRVGWILICD